METVAGTVCGRLLRLKAPEASASHIVRTMKRTGRWYEHRLIEAIRRLRVEGVYVDVGAHIGTHTVAFSEVCRATRVVAIEPHERNLRYLRANAEGRSVKIVQTAVSSEWSMLRLDVAKVVHPDGHVFVEAESLDAVLVAIDERDAALIKIDVAKHMGFDALKSAAATIERCRPVIAIEACEEDEQQEVRAYLTERGYTLLGCFEATPTYLYAVIE